MAPSPTHHRLFLTVVSSYPFMIMYMRNCTHALSNVSPVKGGATRPEPPKERRPDDAARVCFSHIYSREGTDSMCSYETRAFGPIPGRGSSVCWFAGNQTGSGLDLQEVRGGRHYHPYQWGRAQLGKLWKLAEVTVFL